MKKKYLKFFFIIFFLLFTTYTPFDKDNEIVLFPIEKITIENTRLLSQELILIELSEIYNTDLLLFDEKKLNKILRNFKIIQGATVKKVFPNTLKIHVKEKEILAVLVENKKKHLISDDGNLIDIGLRKDLKSLPTVFGGKNEFITFYKVLKKINFSINEIKNFYYFDIGRWDIEIKNGNIIKLPVKDYRISLINYMRISKNSKFKNYSIFDYRIKDQIILN